MKIAVVTGASSGMGREFVLQLAERKEAEEIWAIARNAERLEALKQEVELPVRCISLDVSDMQAIEEYSSLLETEKPEVI